jgi:hypothetical protein
MAGFSLDGKLFWCSRGRLLRFFWEDACFAVFLFCLGGGAEARGGRGFVVEVEVDIRPWKGELVVGVAGRQACVRATGFSPILCSLGGLNSPNIFPVFLFLYSRWFFARSDKSRFSQFSSTPEWPRCSTVYDTVTTSDIGCIAPGAFVACEMH